MPLGSQNSHPCPRNGQGWTGEGSPNTQGQKELSLCLPWWWYPARKMPLAQFCLCISQTSRLKGHKWIPHRFWSTAEHMVRIKQVFYWEKMFITNCPILWRAFKMFLCVCFFKNKERKKRNLFISVSEISLLYSLHVSFSILLANATEWRVGGYLPSYPKPINMRLLTSSDRFTNKKQHILQME